MADEAAADEPSVTGDRGIASVNQARSLQSRMSNWMAMGLMGALGLGFLFWYYSQAWAHQKAAKEEAHKAVRASAQGDMPLPPLGKIDPTTGETVTQPGKSPDLPSAAPMTQPVPPGVLVEDAVATRRAQVLSRRLDGPVFAVPEESAAAAGATFPRVRDTAPIASADTPPMSSDESGTSSLLKPSVSPAVRAKVLADTQLVLPKGAFIDCTLETAIDSSLPGLTTCVTATDTFGADGKVVLLERGTKLVGETKGDVRQGTARIFVLWTEARTPTGVVVPLASPGTDELGRSGLPGVVDRHFFDRFGAAILVSIVEGTIQAAAQPKSGGAVIVNPTVASDVVTEVLKSTINIPPTVRKQNGDRIQILVARDLDFRSVYALRPNE